MAVLPTVDLFALFNEIRDYTLYQAERQQLQENVEDKVFRRPYYPETGPICLPKHAPRYSSLEAFVINKLCGPKVMQLDYICKACEALYEDSEPFVQRLLLALWQKKSVLMLPEFVLCQYAEYKHQEQVRNPLASDD